MLLKKETWIVRFTALSWKLSGDARPDTHLERARQLHESMGHLDPREVAEQDFASAAFPPKLQTVETRALPADQLSLLNQFWLLAELQSGVLREMLALIERSEHPGTVVIMPMLSH